jgi:hypothetical protein
MSRARQCLGKQTKYVLGNGGGDPTKPFPKTADCSGFVAWALGIPRELPPRSGKWLSTDEYYAGGGPAGQGLFDPVTAAEVGDIIVYPDYHAGGRKHEGHMGIVSAVASGKPSKVIHCSLGGWNKHGDAVRETDASIWTGHGSYRVVRPDFDTLRAMFGFSPKPGSGPNGTFLRLIVGKLTGDADEPYTYKHFGNANFVGDHFEIDSKSLGDWLGVPGGTTIVVPVRQALDSLGVHYSVNASHMKDASDPRVFIFTLP